jgi:hypothetical protein
VNLDSLADDDERVLTTVSAQAEPHRAAWLPARHLPAMTGAGQAPDGGSFEDWSRIAVAGIY